MSTIFVPIDCRSMPVRANKEGKRCNDGLLYLAVAVQNHNTNTGKIQQNSTIFNIMLLTKSA